VTFFGDQAWFFFIARDALLTGQFPLLGVGSSITWLHHGPLWSYILMPFLLLVNFDPTKSWLLTLIINLATLILLFFFTRKLFGKIPAVATVAVYLTHPFIVFQSQQPYHTLPLPLFTLIFFLSLIKKRLFIAGLFLGFLYQLHLLTIIYWPVLLYYLIKNSELKIKNLSGFILGILPFLLSGPIKALGIFLWLAKNALTGFSAASSGISDAYWMVMLAPFLLGFAFVLSRFPHRLQIIIASVYIFFNLSQPRIKPDIGLTKRISISQEVLAQSDTNQPLIKVTGPGSQWASWTMPYEYLVWWLSRTNPPGGTHTQFLVDEPSGQISVLK